MTAAEMRAKAVLLRKRAQNIRESAARAEGRNYKETIARETAEAVKLETQAEQFEHNADLLEGLQDELADG